MTQRASCFVPRPDVASGLWKFTTDVDGISDLIGVAQHWLEEEPDNWLRLYVRKCSKDQYGIGFEYKLAGPDYSAGFRRFFHKITDQLKRKFGNNFIGWDVAPQTIFIKDRPPA